MAIGVAATSLVSPLALTPAEHVFYYRAEVSAYSSGAFTDRDGRSFPIHDCAWIPASRPALSRICLLAKQALAKLRPTDDKTPIVLVGPEWAVTGDAELVRFLRLAGHNVAAIHVGAASFVHCVEQARTLLDDAREVIVLAADTLLHRSALEEWAEERYSAFTRNPPSPSEGAAAMRLVATGPAPCGKILSYSSARSEARDDNDLPADGSALARAFAEVTLPARVPLVVGPRDVGALRARDFQIAAARFESRLGPAKMPSLEGRVGSFGNASGCIAAVFALAWLRHDLALGEVEGEPVALTWSRSSDGTLAAMVVGAPS